MKSIILIALALVAITLAAPVDEVKLLRADFVQLPDGGYQFIYELDDGTSRQEEGYLKEVVGEDNKPHSVIAVRGSYTYRDPEGKPDSISYNADENGYHAEGESIPRAVVV